ncbi:MAG: ABC transporter permease [bacterium]
MLKNYLIISIRNFFKNKTAALINIGGLALGIACSSIIALYVIDELSYDQFHQKHNRIYRLTYKSKKSQEASNWAITQGIHSKFIAEYFPEVKTAVRICPSWGSKQLLRYREKVFYEDNFYWTDPNVFEVFDFKLLQGDPRTALSQPYSVVITPAIAKKYFGDENPIGKAFTKDTSLKYVVTGIVAPAPANSHLKFDFLATTKINVDWEASTMWVYTYLLLDEANSAAGVQTRLPDFIQARFDENAASSYSLNLQPLSHIHFETAMHYDLEPASARIYPYAISVVGLLILLIASINYVNLATARSTQRAKEVGLRKVIGGFRFQLIKQFFTESLLYCFFAVLFALVIMEISLPYINVITGKTLSLAGLGTPFALLLPVVLIFAVGLLAGIYPAIVLSSFRPIDTLKGTFNPGHKGLALREGLVFLQIAVSVMLISCTLVINRQLHYFQNKDLGFNKEQVLVTELRDLTAVAKINSLKSELLRHPNIQSVSKMQSVPAQLIQMYVSAIQPEGLARDEAFRSYIFDADYDFVETLGIELIAGRNFSRAFGTDSAEAVIINEALAKRLGWENPLGKRLVIPVTNQSAHVIGVAKDFHFVSLHSAIEPALISLTKNSGVMLATRFHTANLPETLDHIKKTWEAFNPGYPFEFFFLDEYFGRQYRSEQKMGQIIFAATGLAVFIVCLGLFGLIQFAAETRRKEIGIRKVLGATVPSVIALLSKDFMKLAAIANLVAWPAAWYAMSKWLQNFAYRIEIGWWIFALAGGLALLIALLTVSAQAIKAALANPVEALRYE